MTNFPYFKEIIDLENHPHPSVVDSLKSDPGNLHYAHFSGSGVYSSEDMAVLQGRQVTRARELVKI